MTTREIWEREFPSITGQTRLEPHAPMWEEKLLELAWLDLLCAEHRAWYRK
jgi:hypothetical protein